jgi:hypothetical protein
MPRESEWWRRWPIDPTYRRTQSASNAVAILDSISLTKAATEPVPPVSSTLEGGSLLHAEFNPATGPEEPPMWRSHDGALGRARDRLSEIRNAPRRPVAVAAFCLVLLIAAATFLSTALSTQTGPPVVHLPRTQTASQVTPGVASQLSGSSSHLNLPAASTFPTPALGWVTGASTAAHEVFAYAPYWSLPQSSQFPVNDVSTLAYFSVGVNADGSIDGTGPGFAGFQSQDFVNLVSRAHQAGDRVVVTATDFSQPSLDALTHSPDAGAVLGRSLLYLVKERNLDGVNLDFEGTGSADREGYNMLVAEVAAALHEANPNYQLTVSTYGSSAGDANGFFDIEGLAPSVNAFFVMTYDMNNPTVPGPTAPLVGSGYTDETVVNEYLALVPASKIILGAPLYGYDWPTTGPGLGAAATGRATAVPYNDAALLGPTYWDPNSDTVWTSYQSNGQWHQVFFDDADTLALKAQLVSSTHLLGIGVWALGMEGSDNSVLTALTGSAGPLHLPPVGPSAFGSGLMSGLNTTDTTVPQSPIFVATPTTSTTTTTTKPPKCTGAKASKCSAPTTSTTSTTPTTSSSTTTSSTTTPSSTTTTPSSTTTTTPSSTTTSTTTQTQTTTTP